MVDEQGISYELVDCGRKDCTVIARAYRTERVRCRVHDLNGIHTIYERRAVLLPEWEYLLESGAEEPSDPEALRAAHARYRKIGSDALDAMMSDGNGGYSVVAAVAEKVLNQSSPEGWQTGRGLRPMVLPPSKPSGKKRKKR